jgi:hypothetical protein
VLIRLSGIFVLLFSFGACNYFQRVEEENPIAKVNESYLYFSDIDGIVPAEVSTEDSISIITNYINNWAKEELILQKALLNLVDIDDEIQKDVEEYRRSKIVYLYEKELVRQSLDTTVTEIEIGKYYEQNKSNFELKDYILQPTYVKLEKNTPSIKDAEKWIQSDDEKDEFELEDYCHKYAVKFLLNKEEWIFFKDINNEMNLEILNTADFLKSNKFIAKEDNNYLHLLKINAYVMKDSISPLSMERENIKNIILNKRKISLIKKMHKDVYQNALNRGRIEIYNK